MEVGCAVDRIVPDPHRIPSSPFIPGACHLPVTYGLDRSPGGSGIIHPGMRLDFSGDRMTPCIGESRTYPGILQRSLEELLAHTLAPVVPIDIAAILLVEHYCREFLVLMREDRIPDSIDGYHLPVTLLLIIKHLEAVILLQGKEVHSPGIYVRKLENQQRRDTGIEHVIPQRRGDRDFCIFSLDGDRPFGEPHRIRLTAFQHKIRHRIFLVYDIFRHMSVRSRRQLFCSRAPCIRIICTEAVA